MAHTPDRQQSASPWFMAGAPLNSILDLDYWRQQDLMFMTDRYLHYCCTGNQKVGDEACSGFVKVSHRVDDAVVGRIREVAESGALQQLAAEEVHRMVKTTVEPKREERDRILDELSRISDDFTKWANRLDRGIVDEDQFEHHNRTLLNRKEKLQGRLEEIQEVLGEYDSVEVNLQEVQAALSGFGELWEEGTLEERKAVMAELVEDLRVTKSKVTLKLRFMDEDEIPIKYGR